MKQQTFSLIGFITAMNLVIIGFSSCAQLKANKESADFTFDLRSREFATVTKQQLLNSETVGDFMPNTTNWPKHPISDLKLTVFKNETQDSSKTKNLVLTENQKRLLLELDYNDIFTLNAQCDGPNPDEPSMTDYEMYYAFTVVPEKEAVYPGGEKAMVDFIWKESLENRLAVKQEDLKRGFAVFTISVNGKIRDARHEISCGYPAIDDKIVDLLNSLPETWSPAENEKGEKVEQEFLFFYGMLNGC